MRGIPSISADGATVSGPSPEHGQLASLRHGGMDVLYGRRPQELLDACTPPPARLLLSHAVQTRADKWKSAQGAALAVGLFAMFPMLMAWCLLIALHVRSGVVLSLSLVAVVATMVHAFLREVRSPKNAWQRTMWLDFESRELRLRFSLLDDGHAPVTDVLPIAELALICFPHQWELQCSFDIGLIRKDQLPKDVYTDPACLCMLHSSNDEHATRELATALAAAWGMECHARLGNQWVLIGTAQVPRAGV